MILDPRVAVLPQPEKAYSAAVEQAGGVFVDDVTEANSIVWTDSKSPEKLREILSKNSQIRWVQLPFAGVDNFKPLFSDALSGALHSTFTSAKGAYREPVAEHALMLALALARVLPERLAAKTWGRKFAASLYDAKVLILGGGGIAEELVRLLAPFRADISVIRRNVTPMACVSRVADLSSLDDHLATADFVFVAAALTEETHGIFNAERFERMKASAYFVNVARGAIVDSRALADALTAGALAGAGIDVTDPEPLPDGHFLWSAPNLIITPHTADTPEMCVGLLAERIIENVVALRAGEPLVGQVNLKLGY
ncbi:MAG: NAD(P)-dependent oxidoreductase [Rhodoluna sp.]